jgi:hypothetical protein
MSPVIIMIYENYKTSCMRGMMVDIPKNFKFLKLRQSGFDGTISK